MDVDKKHKNKEELNMFTRLNQTIIKAIDKVFDKSAYDFSKWWQDDFETDYGYDTEEELRGFPENELDCVKSDWVCFVAEGFVSQTLAELGIDSSVIKTDSQQAIIEEIYDVVKDELKKKIELEWKKAKQIIVTNIKWDAPKSADLPKKNVININKDNEYLLEDINGYADELCNYLSDEYEYCIKGFNIECK